MSGKKPTCELKSLCNLVTLCVLLAVVLLLCHDPFLLLWWPQKPFEKPKAGGLPLDMATDSIDDMFDGCRPEVAPIIHLFAVFEWHFNRKFSFAWASGERNAKKPAHKGLEEDHATVMYMYTKEKNIQQDFNKAVKTGKDEYSTYSFTFHYFYFFLTDAIQVLRHSQTSCRTTYHRTWRRFDHRVIDTNMRFGAFTWGASSKQSFDLNGNVSCFEIISCFGADITHYSATNQMGQVLIPPYEVFKVTDVLTNDPWCSVVYKLQSTRIPRSDLNCKLNTNIINTDFRAISHADSVQMMSVCIMLLFVISLVLVKRNEKCFVTALLGALLVLIIIVAMLRISK